MKRSIGFWGASFPKVMFGLAGLGINLASLAGQALARPTPPPLEDPAHWATVTHPGNAPYTYDPPLGQTRQFGQVNHEYRISKTETTAREWIEFVQAYKPYVNPAFRQSAVFTSVLIRRQPQPDGTVNYSLNPGVEDRAIEVGFRFAARYCNWLHNNKASNREAFENGVFDTSTFAGNSTQGFTDQATRSPGARFWIPDEDEWIKAAYFDPNRYGTDQPGYWTQPNASDTLLISGLPGVGQTSAGDFGAFLPVGSYPNVTSPWGLLDISGSRQEWCEDVYVDQFTLAPFARMLRGSYQVQASYDLYDGINGRISGDTMDFGIGGVRLASIVPSPGVASGAALGVTLSFLRRRR